MTDKTLFSYYQLVNIELNNRIVMAPLTHNHAEKGPVPSSFAADKTDYPREVCEHVLAHKLPDVVEAAYLRGAYLEKRKALMADWAEFCKIYMA